MLAALDPSAIRRWASVTVDALEQRRQELDELNVFPVPDGDTGTNLVVTVRAALSALRAVRLTDPAANLEAMARGAVLGACGSSGVILSQILRGVAVAWRSGGEVDAARLAAGLARGAELAYAAVAAPVEGTILTVARAAADAAAEVAARGAELAAVIQGAVAGAARAVAGTPEQLEALARAGVVDAGGRGLLVVLEALAAVVDGEHGGTAVGYPGRDPATPVPAVNPADPGVAPGADRYRGPEYEVQYLLLAGDGEALRLRAELAELGDAVAVVGTGDGRWNVHAHVDDVGAAIEAGIVAGRPSRITVTRFADQLAGRGSPHGAPPATPEATGAPQGAGAPEATGAGSALVAMVAAPELAALFTADGVHVVTAEPPTDHDTTVERLLAAVRACGRSQVVILPNDADLLDCATDAAARARGDHATVAVVPSRSPVQGLAAVAVHDPWRRFDDDLIAMTEAAAATRHAAVMVAARDALTMAGQCRAGDVLGLVEDEVVLIGGDVARVGRELLERLLATGGELVTLLVGADEHEGTAAELAGYLAETRPEIEVVTYRGGHRGHPLLVGVE